MFILPELNDGITLVCVNCPPSTRVHILGAQSFRKENYNRYLYLLALKLARGQHDVPSFAQTLDRATIIMVVEAINSGRDNMLYCCLFIFPPRNAWKTGEPVKVFIKPERVKVRTICSACRVPLYGTLKLEKDPGYGRGIPFWAFYFSA